MQTGSLQQVKPMLAPVPTGVHLQQICHISQFAVLVVVALLLTARVADPQKGTMM